MDGLKKKKKHYKVKSKEHIDELNLKRGIQKESRIAPGLLA